jgi:hypothetical protein
MKGPGCLGRAVVAAWIALLSTVAGGAGRADAVAHGESVPDGKYAFAVKITDLGIPVLGGGTRDSYCSGGLISPHWVLTAGHCFRDAHDARVSRPVARRTIATVGRADLDSRGGHDVRVIAVRQNRTVDVALAELDTAISDVAPMRVGRAAPRVGQRVRLTGYGFTTAKATKGPHRLRTGTFRVVSVARTTIGMSGVRPARNTSPCLHDSGGPYFAEGKDGTATVVGVVSHGPDCPHTGADQVSRLDTIASWIRSVIGTDSSPSPSPSARPSPIPALTPATAAAPNVVGPAAFPFPRVGAGAVAAALMVLTVGLWRRTGRRGGGAHRRRATRRTRETRPIHHRAARQGRRGTDRSAPGRSATKPARAEVRRSWGIVRARAGSGPGRRRSLAEPERRVRTAAT